MSAVNHLTSDTMPKGLIGNVLRERTDYKFVLMLNLSLGEASL